MRIHTRPKNNYSKFQANFEDKVFVEVYFSKNATVINPIIHGGKKSHRYVKKAAAKS